MLTDSEMAMYLRKEADLFSRTGGFSFCPRCGVHKLNPNVLENPCSLQLPGVFICNYCYKEELARTQTG